MTAFHPDYKMTGPPCTTTAELERAFAAGKEAGLRYVYPGNLPGLVGDLENTDCPTCGAALVRRRGFTVIDNRMKGSACSECGTAIPGVWEEHAPKHSDGLGVPRALRI